MNRIVSVIAAVGIGVTAGSMVLFITLPMLTAWWRTAYETQLQTVLSVNDSVEQYAPITEAVVQQHPAPATVTGSCPADYERLFHEEFSLCYPSFFERMENMPAGVILFSAADLSLVIEPRAEPQWPLHLCNVEQQVTIDGREAVRTVFRTDQGAGCGQSRGYATVIDQKKGKPSDSEGKPFYLGLFAQNSVFPDKTMMETIEQSLSFSD